MNGLNWQLSVQIDFVPRLQSLTGMTSTQRRQNETTLRDTQARIEKNKIARKRAPTNKIKDSTWWGGWSCKGSTRWSDGS